MWNEDYENGRLRLLIRTNEITNNTPLKVEVNCDDETYVLELLINITKNIIDNENPNDDAVDDKNQGEDNSNVNKPPADNQSPALEDNTKEETPSETSDFEIIPASFSNLPKISSATDKNTDNQLLEKASPNTKRVVYENIVDNKTGPISELSSLRT